MKNIDKPRRPIPETSSSESYPELEILVADNHPVVRIGVANLLQAEKGLLVVGEAGTPEDAIRQTLALQPTILLLDFKMREVLHSLQGKSSSVRVILLVEEISRLELIDALHQNAHGFLLQSELPGYLARAMRTVADGLFWIRNRQAWTVQESIQLLPADVPAMGRDLHGLTPREMEIVRCVVESRSNRDIAQKFALSEETVKRHLSNVFEKTGVTTRLELALFAIRNELVVSE